jgi:hypothetical protein
VHLCELTSQIHNLMATSPTDAGSNSARERVRFKLNEEKVKLWLPPFSKEDGQKGEYPSVSSSILLNLSVVCYSGLFS